MRLIVVSDTHACTDRMDAALDTLRALKGDMYVHLGDYVSDRDYLQKRLGVPFVAVPGNGDWGIRMEKERVLAFGDKRLLLCHGHTLGVKSGLLRLCLRAQALECDGALFGHTHEPYLGNENGLFLLNPGSLGYNWMSGRGMGVGIVELEGGQLRGALL